MSRLRERLDNNFYSSWGKPNRPKKRCHKCKTIFNNGKFCRECGVRIDEVYKRNWEIYQKELDSWKQLKANLDEQFIKDLFEEFNVMDNDRSRKAFGLAWSYGRHEGLESVVDYFADLVDLL